jgi:mono/diheme cytochrome c family protein
MKEDVMTRMTWFVGSASAVLILAAGAAAGQQTAETFSSGISGSAVYKTYCAVCHGVNAKGDGPLAANLRHAPPDLTSLAKRNEGKFDDSRVHRMIDGRDPIKGHGGPDMPIWGDAFKRSSEKYDEKAVKQRIEALVGHLKSVQLK